MTIDEAIRHCGKVAEEQEELYRICPASESEMSHCNGTKDCIVLKNGKNKGCQKCAAEHRQLARWLEELKSYRASVFSRYMTQKMLKEEYDKAIDDIKEKLMQNGFIYTQHALDVFNEIAEQLKAGGDNEGECRDIDEGLLDLSSHDAKVRADTIDNFVKEICKMIVQSESNGNYRFYAVDIKQSIADLAEQLKAGDIK